MGIVNPGQLAVYEEIDKTLLTHVEDVLLNRRPDATERLVAYAEGLKATEDGRPAYRVRRMFVPDRGRGAEMIPGTPSEVAARIAAIVKERLA